MLEILSSGEVSGEIPLGGIAIGPRGGDLDAVRPTYRSLPHNGEEIEPGVLRLHNGKTRPEAAYQGTVKEQPWHAMAACMLVANFTMEEVAEAAGVTLQSIAILKAQQWFQDRLAYLAARKGADLNGMIRAHAIPAISRIVSLSESAESERVRLAANQDLLDRAIGKATQKTISLSASTTFSSAAEEEAHLRQELENLRRTAPAHG